MKLNVEVVGMKAFKGSIDNKEIDSATLYARVKMDSRTNRADGTGVNWKVGEAVEEWKLPSSEYVLRMKHLTCPFVAELEVERLSNGRETKDVVMDVRPMEAQATPPVRKVA